ncbi:uncharacterized protein [Solanum lycopersicum]|uniref:uncharacterized protein n=1 Tax=Solanum lycopersicum TaxID=4081 RepID=UPI0037497EB3
MSNLSKLDFVALDKSGKNYLSWVLDVEIHLTAKGLKATINQGNEASSQDKAKAMIFLRHHLDEGLKIEYLTVKDPLKLWTDLKGRYDHLKVIVLPRARYEWTHLQFQQQYREKSFQKYSELISYILVVEQHNALLMKNHEVRPTGSAPLPEVNMMEARDQSEVKRDDHRGYNNAHGRGKDKRRYTNRPDGGHNKRENNMSSQNNPSKRNNSGASSSNARAESHMTLKDDDKLGTS